MLRSLPTTTTARILILRSATAPPSADWDELGRCLPRVELARDGVEATELLRTRTYDLVLADTALADALMPGGTFFGLFGLLVARQRSSTMVVQVGLPEGPRWVKLVESGEFDPEAEPMTSERFWSWLEDWLEKSAASERVEAA